MLAVDDDVCSRVFVAGSHVQHLTMHLAYQQEITSASQNGQNHRRIAEGQVYPQDKNTKQICSALLASCLIYARAFVEYVCGCVLFQDVTVREMRGR